MKDKEAGRGFDYPALARGLSQWYLSLDERFHVVEVHAPGPAEVPHGDPVDDPLWRILMGGSDDDPRATDLRSALEAG